MEDLDKNAIVVDAMGGDRAPGEIVAGAAEAARTLGHQIVLVGPESIIRQHLDEEGGVPDNLHIVHASGVVTMGEKATVGLRRRESATQEESSIGRAMRLLKEGKGGALVSAGNTGAVMANALTALGRIKGISRPAIGVILPARHHPVVLLDAGANADCKSSYLVQFAHMGVAFAKCIFNMSNPRTGLVNIGEESTKGNALTQDTYKSLSHSPINFVGNVEGQQVLTGDADVIICDGFTGNVVLKTLEGMVEFFSAELREEIHKTIRGKLGGSLLMPTLKSLAERHDSESYGGAYLLGVKGVIVISHGRSSRKAITAACELSAQAIESELVETLEKELAENPTPDKETGEDQPSGKSPLDPPLQWQA